MNGRVLSIAQMHARLQPDSLRVDANVRLKPSKEWTDVRSVRLVVHPDEELETGLTHRYPYAPNEWVRFVPDRQFQTAAHEEVLVIDSARIRGEATTSISFSFRDGEIVNGVVHENPGTPSWTPSHFPHLNRKLQRASGELTN